MAPDALIRSQKIHWPVVVEGIQWSDFYLFFLNHDSWACKADWCLSKFFPIFSFWWKMIFVSMAESVKSVNGNSMKLEGTGCLIICEWCFSSIKILLQATVYCLISYLASRFSFVMRTYISIINMSTTSQMKITQNPNPGHCQSCLKVPSELDNVCCFLFHTNT